MASSQAASRSRSLSLVVVAGCLIGMLCFGPRSTMGLFLAPMTEARGWSREIFALSIAIQNLIWGLAQPFAGAIADRYGSARVLAVGGVIYAAGLALMSWAPTALWLDVSAGVLVGVGIAATSFSLVLAVFSRRVPANQRSFYFGVGTAAGSMGQFLFAPLGQGMIATVGWQQALLVLAALTLVIPLAAGALAGRPSGTAHDVLEQTFGQALGEALSHRGFLLLTTGFFVCGFQLAFITTHLPPYLVDRGLAPSLAGWSLALIGLFNVAGSLASGVIGQRYPKPIFLACIYLGRAAAIAVFVLLPASPAATLVFAAVMGLLWLSTIPPTYGLVAVMFGPRYMATLTGIVFLSHQVGSFLGVWLGGRLYDQTGSYNVVWWISVALGVFAAAVHWPIREAPAARLATA